MTAPDRATADLAFQREMLARTARTFALTLRPLPGTLPEVVGNLYLLCRILDTIEDDPGLPPDRKDALSERFVRCVGGDDDPADFARELGALLSPAASESERRLVAGAPRVLRVAAHASKAQQDATRRCVRIMAAGMAEFQRTASPEGLPDLPHLDRYCYHVAGVVGETLTAFFCDHSPEAASRREELLPLAVSFGQGLQLVNVLQDVWEDRRRGACWLPRDLFREHGVELATLVPEPPHPGFAAGLTRMIALTRGHLEAALRYVLLLPKREPGIRRSCLWPLGLALLTLRRLHRTPGYRSRSEVKVSRRAVWAVVLVTSISARSNRALRLLFRVLTRGLPRTPVTG